VKIWRVYVFVWMRLRVFADNHPSPSIFAVCLICFSVCVCLFGVWLRGRERGRDSKNVFFFFSQFEYLYILLSPQFFMLCVGSFVWLCVCVCVWIWIDVAFILNRKPQASFSLTLSLSIRFWIVFVEKRHFCFRGESIWQQIIGSSKYSWILKLGRLRAYYVI
jgi:hypothetical protein